VPTTAASTPSGLYEAAFDSAWVGMAVVAPNGRIVRANAALGELLGVDARLLTGRDIASLVEEQDREVERVSRESLAGGARTSLHTDLHLLHASGRALRVTLMRTLARGHRAQGPCLIDQVQDLTERQRAETEIVLLNNLLEQRIRRRTAQLEESNEDLRGFASSIAHDLRGPLASIDGFSAQLERRLAGSLDERNAHYLRRVRAGVQQMSELTDGLLALADLSRAELRHAAVDLSEIARSIATRLHEHEPSRAVEFDIADTPLVRGDPRLLATVLENLLGNAWKFTAHTSMARIRFRADIPPGEACRFHVEDNGAGFDPAGATRLFGAFQRLHTAREFEGRGIGLALVRKIVTRHGGHIWAEGKPGRGAAFHFTLEPPPGEAR
jgi:PAS domain S-box-containing protein